MTLSIAIRLAGRCLLLTLLLSGGMRAAAAQGCPKGVPPGLSAIAVGSGIVLGGRAMAISQVQGPGKAAAVIDRVEQAWKEGGHQVRRASTAGWDTVAAQGATCLVTLQLADRKGVFGYLAHSTPSTAPALTPRSFGVALPPDATVNSSVASSDDGRKGLVVSLSSSRPLDQLNAFFMRALGEANWSALRSHKIVNPVSGKASLLVTGQRGRNQVELVMWPEGRTQVVMTISEAL